MMARNLRVLLTLLCASLHCALGAVIYSRDNTCTIHALGNDQDDSEQILAAVDKCGTHGRLVFPEGEVYSIQKLMIWNLTHAHVDLYGTLSFFPNITYWLDKANTYQVFIQSQSTYFVVSGSHFNIDAHGTGGINGNGQAWWSYFNDTGVDGEGRPISLTVENATHASINNFNIIAPPFWSNLVDRSHHITYDGMFVNATNTDPIGYYRNLVPNTDGIDTYRSDHITLKNWDITCGDDCIALKGNSTNIGVHNITCRGGNGLAVGSLGQYDGLEDIVDNVDITDVNIIRLDPKVQPDMGQVIYFKTYVGVPIGTPPLSGGGGTGYVSNLKVSNAKITGGADWGVALTQTSQGGEATNLNSTVANSSTIQFSNLTFENFQGSTTAVHYPFLIDILCSASAPCYNVEFSKFNLTTVNDTQAGYICEDVTSIRGLPGPCTPSGF